LLGWGPEPGNLSQKLAITCLYYDITHGEPKKKKENLNKTGRLAKSVEGLNTSLNTIGWQVMELQNLVKKVACVGLQGFENSA